jgi:hypothetical protein
MQTVEILPDATADKPSYRAICGGYQAIGQTPGQALDTLEAQLESEAPHETGETLVILQRLRADDLFTAEQQQRLRKLMDQHHGAIADGKKLDDPLQTELEQLVQAELEANIQRSQRLLQRAGKTV